MRFPLLTILRPRAATAVATLLLAFGRGDEAMAGASVYVVGSSNEFGTLDLSTGAFTQLGVFPLPGRHGPFPIYGLGFTGPGQLTAVDARGNFFSVDPSNAAETPLYSTGTFPNGGGGDGHGSFYLFDTGTASVDAVNVADGSITPLASFPGSQSTGFTAVGPDGFLYVTVTNSAGPNFDDLYRIDPHTGVAMDIGPDTLQLGLLAGVFVGSTLYGFDSLGGIYTIDTATGLVSEVGAYSLPNGDAIYSAAFQAVPEPASVALLGIGLAGVLEVHRRRKPR